MAEGVLRAWWLLGLIWSSLQGVDLSVTGPESLPIGEAGVWSGTASAGQPPYSYRFDFGDGTSTGWQDGASASHAYTEPGRWTVNISVRDDSGGETTRSMLTVAHRALQAVRPTSSQTIALDADRGRLWVVNPDQDSVALLDLGSGTRLRETVVGDHPAAVTVDALGRGWVVCRDSDVLVRCARDGTVEESLDLPYGSRPSAIAATPTGEQVVVVCRGRQQLRIFDATATGPITEVGVWPCGPQAGHLAIVGREAWVAWRRSPVDGGTVERIDLDAGQELSAIRLLPDPGPDTERSGRGLPNQLGRLAITPDGYEAWIPALKANLERGLWRDGNPLTFESTIRTVTCRVLVDEGLEQRALRKDHDDAADAVAVAFSPLGDVAVVALRGIDRIDCFATATGELLASRATGSSPISVVVNDDHIFVHEFLDRHVAILDARGLLRGESGDLPLIERISTSADEALSATELAGKRLFYRANDDRINRDHYIACASCHTDGGHDGQVWDFTDRGEGLRNTPTLRGRRGTGHGPVHWSANFDEIQDFEHDLRGPFGGAGLMDDAIFFSGDRFRSLGGAKAGLNTDLDALAAYVASLDTYPRSPHRRADGSPTAAGERGRLVFARLGCVSCHGGDDYTDSATRIRHDVGTIRASSGQRLGGVLDGIDTPTLRGLWATPPYLHDGRAVDLAALFDPADPTDVHRLVATRSAAEQADLIAFLRELDGSDTAVVPTVTRSVTIAVVGRDDDWESTILPRHAQSGGVFSGLSPALDYVVRWAKSPDQPVAN